MKFLLASLVAMSLFAADNFETDKANTVKRLQASNATPSVVKCAEKAKTMDELTACEKAPTTEVHARAPHHKAGKTKHI
ncbi:MAG: hypothetical protein ACHQYQ_00560 [Bacteriovoracales bacterium]